MATMVERVAVRAAGVMAGAGREVVVKVAVVREVVERAVVRVAAVMAGAARVVGTREAEKGRGSSAYSHGEHYIFLHHKRFSVESKLMLGQGGPTY